MLNKFVAVGLTATGITGIIVSALAVGGHFDATWLADPTATWTVCRWHTCTVSGPVEMPNAPTLLAWGLSLGGLCSFLRGTWLCADEWPWLNL